MKLLIDENLPKSLKADFPEYDIYHVSDKGWNSKKNSELLQLMIKEKFEVLFTFDKNLQHQQNFEKYPVSVFVLNAEDNTYSTLQTLIPFVKKQLLGTLTKGAIVITI